MLSIALPCSWVCVDFAILATPPVSASPRWKRHLSPLIISLWTLLVVVPLVPPVSTSVMLPIMLASVRRRAGESIAPASRLALSTGSSLLRDFPAFFKQPWPSLRVASIFEAGDGPLCPSLPLCLFRPRQGPCRDSAKAVERFEGPRADDSFSRLRPRPCLRGRPGFPELGWGLASTPASAGRPVEATAMAVDPGTWFLRSPPTSAVPFGAVEISDAVGEPSAPTHIEVDGHVGTESSSSETAFDVTILVYIEYTGLRARALRPCPDLPGAGSRDTRGPMGTPIGTVWDTRGVLAGPKGGRPVRLFPCTH